MSQASNIAKNASWLIGATVINKLIALVAFALVARLVGPAVTGTYFYSVSVTSIFVVLGDLGMTQVVIRAIAADRADGGKLLASAITAKICLIPIAILGALGFGILNGADHVTLATIAVACIVMSADSIHLVIYGALRGRQNLRPEAIGMLAGQMMTSVFAVTAALLGFGAIGLAVALCTGSLWNVFWSIKNARRMNLKVFAPFDLDTVKLLLKEALPFAVAGIAVKIYSYLDSIMLQVFKGPSAVGHYAVAYKMTYAMQFLPLTFTAALYPAMAASWAAKDHEGLRKTFMGSLRLMAAVSFPLAAGLSALAPRFIPMIYGPRYLESIGAMQILPWVLIPIFMDFPVGSLLNGSHRAHLKTSAMVSTMVINAVLNAFLVPAYGPVGAAWAGIFSFWSLLLVGMMFTAKDAGGLWAITSILLRAFVAAAVSWVAWRWVGGVMPLFASAIFGGCIAILAGFVTKLVELKDILPYYHIIKRKFIGEEIVQEI